MEYICLYTNDIDLSDSFKLFFEGKYLIRPIPDREDLLAHLSSDDCQCQALIFDAINPTEKDVEVLSEIKKNLPSIKVIISYVYFEEKRLTEKLLAKYVDEIIYKPYDFAEVDRRLQALLEKKHQSIDS